MADEEIKMIPIDFNDMGLESESLEGFDPSADAHAFPPPPDDGTHRVKLSRPPDRPWKALKNAAGKITRVGTSLRADSMEEQKYTLFDHRVSTMVMRNGGCAVGDIIRAITGALAKAKDHLELAKELDSLLMGTPIVRVNTRWEASCQDCKDISKRTGKEFNHVIKRGQTHFKPLKAQTNGKPAYNHEIECDGCKVIVGAQATISAYMPDTARAASVETATPSKDPFE